MYILSVDTGLNNFGYSVFKGQNGDLVHYDTIRTKKKKKKGERVSTVYVQQIETIVETLVSVISLYGIRGVTGEMPTFGAQSSKAAISLTSGAAIILTLAEGNKLPTRWVTPMELKEVFTGDPHADKKTIMAKVCEIYGWQIEDKPVFCRKTNKQLRTDKVYHTGRGAMGGNKFEHIADSIAAHLVCLKLSAQV